MNNSKLQIAELDFDAIKANLRNFLKSQSEFKDYDFEGAGLSVLLDILAFNTHYQSFYMNMIGNEMFLDSADLRSSVVSIAKHLSYVPRSVRSSQVIVNLDITPNDDSQNIVVDQNTQFSSTVDGTTFIFVTDRAYAAARSRTDNMFHLQNVRLVEGIPYTYRITVDTSIPKQRFVLPNPNVDTSGLTVRVQRSSADTTLEVFTLANDITEVKGSSAVYFVQEVEDGLYELYFGDGVVGKSLTHGNIVIISYVISKGPDANNGRIFSPATAVGGYPAGRVVVTPLTVSYGGLAAETIEQIKFSAPKNYEAQNRAVTIEDYKTVLQRDYPNLESIAVWGGESEVPPQYGKVYVSLKPMKGFVVTEAVKRTIIKDILKTRNMVSVMPEVKDPDYLFLLVTTKVKYNPAVTNKSLGDIESIVFAAINTFGATELGKFDRVLKYSRLLTAVDNSDTSVSNNLTAIRLQKRFVPRLDAKTNYTFDTNNPIKPLSFISSPFIVVHDSFLYTAGDTHYITDDGLGSLLLNKASIGAPDTIIKKTGTINYATGHIELQELMPYDLIGKDLISLTMTPQDNDVTPLRNTILIVMPEDISVSAAGTATTIV